MKISAKIVIEIELESKAFNEYQDEAGKILENFVENVEYSFPSIQKVDVLFTDIFDSEFVREI